MTVRLIDSGLSQPAFTAAADEAIFLARQKNLAPETLHFYRRDRPTISLGYFQSVQDVLDLNFCKAKGIEIIRRTSGGKAIYTDPGQLIYALVTEDVFPKDKKRAYEKICSALVFGLEELGVRAEFKPINDILVNSRKISGSARKRKNGIILQHGTLILDIDREMMFGSLRVDNEKKNSVTSLKEVLGYMPDVEKVKKAIVKGFERVTGRNIISSGFGEHEERDIERLVSEKYGNPAWNLKL